MTKLQQAQRESFIGKLIQEAKRVDVCHVIHIAQELMRLGKKHGRVAEAECNRELSESEKVADMQTEKSIIELCDRLGKGFVPVFGGDPRGATVKIRVPSGKSDSWGGDGICVPGS